MPAPDLFVFHRAPLRPLITSCSSELSLTRAEYNIACLCDVLFYTLPRLVLQRETWPDRVEQLLLWLQLPTRTRTLRLTTGVPFHRCVVFIPTVIESQGNKLKTLSGDRFGFHHQLSRGKSFLIMSEIELTNDSQYTVNISKRVMCGCCQSVQNLTSNSPLATR